MYGLTCWSPPLCCPVPEHSIRIDFTASGEEGWYKVTVSSALDGEPLFSSTGHFASLLEVIDDARFHADATISLLRETILGPSKP